MRNGITFYWLPNCSTCQKAEKFLKQNGIAEMDYRDIKANPLSLAEVVHLANLAGGANEIFSRRARLYHSMGLAGRQLSDDEMLQLMAKDYTFIKRPVLTRGNQIASGFANKAYKEILDTK